MATNLRELHAALISDGAPIPAKYEDFERYMTSGPRGGYDHRKEVYEALKSDGAPLPGTYEEFSKALFEPVKKTSGTQSAQKTTTSPTTKSSVSTSAEGIPEEKGGNPIELSGVQRSALERQMGDINAQWGKIGAKREQRIEGVKQGGRIGAGMGRREFTPQTGKTETVYYTRQGERVGTRMEQSQRNTAYNEWWETNTEEGRRSREQRLQREYDDRLRHLWGKHDPSIQGGMNAAEKAWDTAESAYYAAAGKNRQAADFNTMAYATSSTDAVSFKQLEQIDDYTDRLTTHDITTLMDNAWANLGEETQTALIEDCYNILRNRYPGADELELYRGAEQLARQQSDQRMYNLAVANNVPRSKLEFFMRKVQDGNLLTSLGKGIAHARIGKDGDVAAYEQAMGTYASDHKVLNIAGMVTGFVADPTTWMSAGVGGAAAKGTLWGLGRYAAGRGATAAMTNAAVRQVSTTLGGRVVAGVVGGAVNFGTFEAIKEAENQFVHGGEVIAADENDDYRTQIIGYKVGDYSAGAIAKQGGHGMLMGAAIGWLGPVSGNVSDKLVRATASTAGKAAIRTGTFIGSTMAEGTIFSVPEWLSGERDAYDVWTDNMAMMIGFKVQHGLKSAPRTIEEFGRTADGRKGMESRIREYLDRPSDGGLALTKDEKAELKEYGYKLHDMVEERWDTAIGEEGDAVPWLVSELTEMVTDPRLSEAVRAKMYYYATGRRLPMSTVMYGELLDDGNGGFIVQSHGANGVITSRTFKNRKAADLELERINRQAELNRVDIGEKYRQDASIDEQIMEASRRVAAKSGWNAVDVYKVYEKIVNGRHSKEGTKELEEAEKAIYGKILNELGEIDTTNLSEVTDAIRETINKKYGVDIDKALAKEINRRTNDEQKAIDEYKKELYKKRDSFEDSQKLLTSGEEAEGEPIDPRFEGVADDNGFRFSAEDIDTWQNQQPIGRAVMKYEDRPVEVLSGRVVMMEDGSMVDKEQSDATIVIRDVATGNIEMCSPDDILTYTPEPIVEGAGADPSGDGGAEPTRKYGAGIINIRNSDGSITQGYLTGHINENGEYEYVTEGNKLHYASEYDLDHMVAEYIPDQAAEPIVAKDSQGYELAVGDEIVLSAGRRGVVQEIHPDGRVTVNHDGDIITYNEAYGDITKTGMRKVRQEGEGDRPMAEAPEWEGLDGVQQIDDETREFLKNCKLELVAIPQPDGTVRQELVAIPQPNGPYETVRGEFVENPQPYETVGGELVENPQTGGSKKGREDTQAEAAEPEQGASEPTPLQRVPKDANGDPKFEATDHETAWDALVEYSEGDAGTAKEIADAMVEEKKKALDKAQKLKLKGKTPAEMLASKKANAAELDKAQKEFEQWQRIAGVEQRRKDAERSAREAEARQRAAERAAQEAAERAAREEAERIEREALGGVPEWHQDTPENARARGYRRYNGKKWERQGSMLVGGGTADHSRLPQGGIGKEVEVKFSTTDMPKGRVAVIEADQLQPSHIQGERNPLFFIEEAQPKNRTDDISKFTAKTIAEGIRPEEITGSTTAYTGAPTVNTRGEVIQGNNRSDALRYLWDSSLKAQQDAYKQYLIDNAEQFGIDAAEVEKMQQPVLVNMLDVDDAEAIRLGQLTAQDTESGGIERIKAKNVAQKLGDNMRTFANMLLRSEDEEASFGQLVDRNGVDVLKWMNQTGVITPTQYQSAFDSKGNLTAEAKNDLSKVLYQAVFKGANQQLEELFDKLPAKAQRAILSTAFRDLDSPFSQKMLGEIQASIRAYAELMSDPNFEGAKKFEEVLRAVQAWTQQTALDDRFETVVPADNYSNFALRLAAMYKASDYSQKTIATTFNEMYDLIQGTVKPDLFNPEPDTTPRTLAEAIKEKLEIDYQPAKNDIDNGRNGSTDVALDHQPSEAGQRRSSEPPASGEPAEGGEEPADGGGRAAEDRGGAGDADVRGGEVDDATNGSLEEEITPTVGPFGEIYTQFKGKPQEAVTFLLAKRGGEAIGALHHKDIGDIDLVWGKEGTGHSDGFGLAKLAKYHPEVLFNLQEVMNDMVVTKRSANRVQLESDKYQAAVRLTWDDKKKTWLLTMFEKKNSALDNTTDTDKTLLGNGNDTATPENTVSEGKGNESLSKEQISGGESSSQPVEGESEQATEQNAKPSKGDFFVSKRTGEVVYVGQITESGKYRLFGEDTASVKTQSELYEIFRPATEDDIASSDWAAKTWKSMRESPSDWGLEGEGNSVQSAVEAASAEVDSKPTEAQRAEGEGYIIEPKPYTNKQGKTLDTYLVRFDRDFSKEEMSALRAKVRAVKGWYDRESGGWMLRSAEEARAFAEEIISKSEDEVADEAPLSIKDTTPAPKPTVKRVDINGVADALRTKGTATLSDHAEPIGQPKPGDHIELTDGTSGDVLMRHHEQSAGDGEDNITGYTLTDGRKVKPEDITPQGQRPKPKKRNKWISDEDAAEFGNLMDDLRRELGGGDIVEEEGVGYGNKPKVKPMNAEVLRKGTIVTYMMMKGGLRKFSDYCEAMVDELGDAIRPHLKSLYAATQNMEEVIEAGWDEEMDDRKTVKGFDVYNFDKTSAVDLIETAQHVVDEQASQEDTENIINELKDKRNEQRRKEADETSANTAAIVDKAEAAASEVEDKLKDAADEETAEALAEHIDENIEKINKQLALLGYYEADPSSKDYNEAYGYMRNAERKATQDAHKLATQIATDLGLTIDIKDKVKKGKNRNFGSKLVSSNIAPAGGEVNIRIPLSAERDLYIRIALDPVGDDMSRKPYRQSDDLQVTGIMYRVEGKGVKASNNYADAAATYGDLLADIKRIVRHYLPEETLGGETADHSRVPQRGEDYVEMAERVSEASQPKKRTVEPEQRIGSLFDDIFGEQEDAESEMETAFVEEVSKRLGREKMNITTLRKIAKDVGLEGRIDTDLQELTELAIVNRAREIAKNAPTLRDGFNQIVELYKSQPTISQRSSERVAKQQYSTPIPLGYMADAFINVIRPQRVLEPSGGNGMMIHAIDPGRVHANDIDKMRLKNLRRQGFAQVTDQDGREAFKQRHYHAIVTNPPFGQAKAEDYDGFPISGLEKQMTINALNSMRDDGRAAIIIGGNTEYDEKGRIKGGDRIFFNYLYSRYNVVDVINVNGELYSRQGTSYPVRMILIDGRRPYPVQEYAPRRADARAEQVTTFEELFNRINDELLRSEELSKAYGDSGGEQGGRSKSERGDSRADDASRPDTSVSENDRERRKSDTAVGGHSAEHDNGARPASGGTRRTGGRGESVDGSATTERQGRSATAERKATGRAADTSDRGDDGRDRGRSGNATNVVVGAGEGTGRVTDSNRLSEIDVEREQRKEDKARRESNVRRTLDENPEVGAVEYISQSNAREIGSTVPANQSEPISKALKRIGDVDEFVRQHLGYADMGQLYAALSAEQIDSVALAITQMANSKGFIIGDMTGVGKGRQAAAIIRWAVKAGHKPIFMTEKANLFSDIYRDLTDIGSGELRPLIINAGKDADITDSNGEVVHRAPRSGDKALKRILESGKIPDEYDFVIMTYSQLNAKDMNAKKTFFMKIAAGNYLVMDESHNAGGDGNTGTFLQNILSGGENTEGQPVRGVTFLSGTFAKRPDNMPIYALKTDIGNSGLTAEEMIQTIIEGGVPLQEIMSRALASSGQMVRRERDFTGVTVDWTTIGNRAEHERQEHQYDSTIGLFNRIIQFQEKYVTPIIEMMDAEIAAQGKEAGGKKGTKKGGVDNQPLFSKTFLVTRQLMFAMKADAVADMVIEQLRQGKKPVVAVDNTMESFADNHLPNTGEFDMPTIAMSYEGHLESCMQYTVKDAQGHESHSRLYPEQLSPEGRAEYNKIIEEIHNATDGVFLSPIDRIKSRVRAAGYSVAELTGRKYEIQETSEGRYSKVSRTDTDKKKSARDFNNGEVDVLILNKSASTGISLHSSKQFGDQRQRVMIIAQPQLDVNTEVQMRGRIDRTGQIWRGHYIYAMCSIPAESRLIMMLKAKLKSLDANTKSSQKSEVSDDSIVDFLNKYGDEICLEYLKEHRELADELYDPLHFEGKEEGEIDAMTAAEGTASKICGRVALLSSARQREFYDEIGRLFTDKINYLNEIGENELVISSLPLAAETKATRVFQHGKDPGKGNEFAEDSIMEECEVNVLRKPLKMAEIQREQERLTDGYTNSDEYKRHLHSIMEEHKAAEIALLNERLSKKLAEAKARKEASIRKEAEKLAKKSGREIDEAEVSAVLAEAIATVEKEHAEKADKMLKALNNRYEAIHEQINSIQYFDTCTVPNKIGIASSGSVYAYVIGVKIPKAGSKLTLVCATLDGRRKVEIPFSDASSMNNVYQSKFTKRLDPLFPTVSTWDKSSPTATRETMYIATGNLLQAYPRMAQGSKIVNFTDKDGNIRQGIIMPKWAQADAGKLMTNTIEPFENIGEAVAEGKKTFRDTHDEVILGWNQREWAYELVVPKSKTMGGKYYLDEGLKSLLERGGNFQQRRNTFVAVVKRENVAKVAKYLSDKFKLKAYVPIEGEASAQEPGAEYLPERKGIGNFASRYETQDGKTINYTSENAEAYGVSEAGGEYGRGDNRGRSSVQRKNAALLSTQHDQLGEGEYAHIERIFRESGAFEFTAGEKVRSAADVAFIFEQLENASVENAFAVLVKGGRPTVVHLSMGGFSSTIVNTPVVKEAAKRINPDQVYFVHNHPSGGLKCSPQDANSVLMMERALGMSVEGVIINLKSGKYGTFGTGKSDEIHDKGAAPDGQRRLRLYAFDRHVFAPDYDPTTPAEVPMNAEEVAKYISSHRLGDRGKISYLIRAHNGGITANIHSPYTEMSYENLHEMADDIISHITNFGGTSAFIYGDFDYTGGNSNLYRVLNNVVRERSGGSYSVLDAVRVGGNATWSAQDRGLMEPGTEYGAKDGELLYREVEEERVLDEFATGKTVKAYRTMQVIDGGLYSPMATKVGGKETPEIRLGVAEQSEEHPEIIKGNNVGKDGEEYGVVVINKGLGKGTLEVAYNPYIHASRTALNDQFTSAHVRPNLVTVEVEIPESELASGYRAESAKNAVGEMPWHSGSVSGQLADLGRPRRVILSRYDKPIRIVPYKEVAEMIAKQLAGTDIEIPYNVVQPQVAEELRRLGVRISDEASGSVGADEDYGRAEYITDEQIAAINARQRAMADESAEGKRRQVEAMSERLNTPVRIIENAEDITDADAAKQAKMRRAKGWYDPKSGEIVVNLSRNRNVGDVAETMLHEVVAHKGLRELVGETRYSDFLREVYEHAKKDVRERIEAKARENGWDFEKATDEYLGDLSEKGFEDFTEGERSIWQKLKQKVLDAINKLLKGIKLPKWVKLGDNELRYMLWRSHENLRSKGNDYVAEARNISKREELGLSDELMYRDPGETDDIWKDGSLGLEERITNASIRLSNNQRGDQTLRNDAMRAVCDNLQTLLHDMRNRSGRATSFGGADAKVERGVAQSARAQRLYDQVTAKRVGDLARVLMQNGYLRDMTSGEMQRIVSALKNATGAEDIGSTVEKIMDIMIGNQEHQGERRLTELLSIRGSKVDARGVEVQGQLDADGARMMQAVRRGMKLSEGEIQNKIAEALNRMGDSDQAIADDAALEYAGLQIALDYVENITGSKNEERDLRESIKEAKAEKDAGRMSADAYNQLVEATEDAIRKNKIERAEAYNALVGRLSDSMRQSIENAKAWREAEKRRIQEIQHNANSDMQGMPSEMHRGKETWKDGAANLLAATAFAPLATFEQMIRGIAGGKAADGEGYLYNRFVRGLNDARAKEISGYRSKQKKLDDKVREIFRPGGGASGHSRLPQEGRVKSWGDVIRLERRLPKMRVTYYDKSAGEYRDAELMQGNLLYIYMVDKMSDGRMKLRKMGITESDVDAIADFLDPRIKALGDWLQEEFLVETRNEYNETHKRMFGASMAAIDNYFPLKILGDARGIKEDIDAQDTIDGATSTITGAIKKRKVNTLALDILGADAFNVVMDHLAEMEHWNAYAEIGRDMNALLSYGKFRNRVKNMRTVYGAGEELWKRFKDVSRIAFGTYHQEVNDFDEGFLKIARGVTAAKVAFRLNTALKQTLSLPAMIPDMSVSGLIEGLKNPRNPFTWCMENLPVFEERWRSRISGDPRLMKSERGWNDWRNNVVEIAGRWGMTPNAFIDAVICSIVAKTIYDTKLTQYIKDGYARAEAEARAKQDASIGYNLSQQSSEGAYLAPIQAKKNWLSVMWTVFRNSPMSYTRQVIDSVRNLKRNLTPGKHAEQIEYMTKQTLREWQIDPDNATDQERTKAKERANRRYSRSLMRDALRLLTYGFVLPGLWSLGGYWLYMLLGNDEEEKQQMKDDIYARLSTAPLEGLTGGDVLSNVASGYLNGTWNENTMTKDMPLSADITQIAKKLFKEDKTADGINDIFNLCIQSGFGFNPATIENAVLGIMDACGNDVQLANEATIVAARILNCPESQVKKLYFDEIGMSGEEASKLSPAEIAERYARMQIKLGRPIMPWLWNDEAAIDKRMNGRYGTLRTAKERFERQGDGEVKEAYAGYKERHDAIDEKVKAAKKLMQTDYVGAAQMMAEVQTDPDFTLYQQFHTLDKQLTRLAGMWIKSKSGAEAAVIATAVNDYRAGMVKVLGATSYAEQQAAMQELQGVMQRFNTDYAPYKPQPKVNR